MTLEESLNPMGLPIDRTSVTGPDPVSRGEHLAAVHPARFRTTLETYERLFAAVGMEPTRVEVLARSTHRALENWAPDLAAEIDAFARAADVEPWRVHALNARTEVLAAGGVVNRGECSTLVRLAADHDGSPLSGQTWDWHQELTQAWLLVEHEGVDLPFVTLTERGVVGKIGLNAAGVGVHFNILSHVSDGARDGGDVVPVHAIARRVLDTARDVTEAEQVVRSATLGASSCFTIVDQSGARCLEATPSGVAAVPSAQGWIVHTNHFLDQDLRRGDQLIETDPETADRERVLRNRIADGPQPATADAMAALLCAHSETDGAPVCCHPDLTAPFGGHWETLATVVLDPAARRMDVAPTGPCHVTPTSWSHLTPQH